MKCHKCSEEMDPCEKVTLSGSRDADLRGLARATRGWIWTIALRSDQVLHDLGKREEVKEHDHHD